LPEYNKDNIIYINNFLNNQKGVNAVKHLINNILKTGSLFSFLAFIVFSGCQQQKHDSSQELKPIVEKYTEVWNNGNVAELDNIMDSNYIYHSNNSPEVNGIDGMKKVITSLRTAYPDLKLAIEDTLFSENKVAARWHVTGTNTGPGEMPPTGKPVDFWGIAIVHIANGKLKEEWTSNDNQSLMEQLGFTMNPPSNKKMK
jgi:steroid delta-isomerase-like uncharacterized protein